MLQRILIGALAGGIVVLLLGQCVLPLLFLHLLAPLGIGALGLVGAVAGVDVVPGVQQAARQRAQTGGAGNGQLHHVPDDAQHRHDVIESLLALADFRLLLRGVVAVQGVQPVQVLLILAVVLGIGVVVRLAFLLQLGVVVLQLTVVQGLSILLLSVQLVQPVHQFFAAALVGIQRQIVQGGDGAGQPADLLLIGLLRRTGGIAGTISAGQSSSLCRRVRAGIVGVLGIQLLVLAVKRVTGVAVLKILPFQQLSQQAVDLILIAALVVCGAVLLPLLQGVGRIGHLLTGAVADVCHGLFHIGAAVQPLGAVSGLRSGLCLRLHLRLQQFLLLFGCHIILLSFL